MNQRCKQPGTSPLIDPAVCCLVLIVPTQSDLTGVSRNVRTGLRRNLLALSSAANIMKVPIFLCSPDHQPGEHGLAKQLRRTRSHREFIATGHDFPWQNMAFTDALAREDRPVLVLAGFWLEHQILATALHALAESYDVYVSLDATPARGKPAAVACQERLVQAGATPVVTSQIIHEWSLEAPDMDKRAALTGLLAHASSSDTR